jgi:hypothetical protein
MASCSQRLPTTLSTPHLTMASTPAKTVDGSRGAPLPPWLARHVNVAFDSDDIAALLDSIESSQRPETSAHSDLPAELLLLILEYVPIDYLLDWRLICRGFRKVIDERVLYHHLRRTQLVGHMGPARKSPGILLSEENYDAIRLLPANFDRVEYTNEPGKAVGPAWTSTHAIFRIEDEWFDAFRELGGAKRRGGQTLEDADSVWLNTLSSLELKSSEEGFGTLRWCIKLDHAVFDLDPPLGKRRRSFEVDIRLGQREVRVAWKPMLLGFLKTETALRRMMEEEVDSKFTFSHTEDCIRAVRRERLSASLDQNERIDRHLMWSLRLLQPLFGKPGGRELPALNAIEDEALELLIFLRREASMTTKHKVYLQELAKDLRDMNETMADIHQRYKIFTAHMTVPGFETRLEFEAHVLDKMPKSPLAWSDTLRADIEDRVGKWRVQQTAIRQIQTLLAASNEALAVPDDAFDEMLSDF